MKYEGYQAIDIYDNLQWRKDHVAQFGGKVSHHLKKEVMGNRKFDYLGGGRSNPIYENFHNLKPFFLIDAMNKHR